MRRTHQPYIEIDILGMLLFLLQVHDMPPKKRKKPAKVLSAAEIKEQTRLREIELFEHLKKNLIPHERWCLRDDNGVPIQWSSEAKSAMATILKKVFHLGGCSEAELLAWGGNVPNHIAKTKAPAHAHPDEQDHWYAAGQLDTARNGLPRTTVRGGSLASPSEKMRLLPFPSLLSPDQKREHLYYPRDKEYDTKFPVAGGNSDTPSTSMGEMTSAPELWARIYHVLHEVLRVDLTKLKMIDIGSGFGVVTVLALLELGVESSVGIEVNESYV
jgi:hypothetical protein